MEFYVIATWKRAKRSEQRLTSKQSANLANLNKEIQVETIMGVDNAIYCLEPIPDTKNIYNAGHPTYSFVFDFHAKTFTRYDCPLNFDHRAIKFFKKIYRIVFGSDTQVQIFKGTDMIYQMPYKIQTRMGPNDPTHANNVEIKGNFLYFVADHDILVKCNLGGIIEDVLAGKDINKTERYQDIATNVLDLAGNSISQKVFHLTHKGEIFLEDKQIARTRIEAPENHVFHCMGCYKNLITIASCKKSDVLTNTVELFSTTGRHLHTYTDRKDLAISYQTPKHIFMFSHNGVVFCAVTRMVSYWYLLVVSNRKLFLINDKIQSQPSNNNYSVYGVLPLTSKRKQQKNLVLIVYGYMTLCTATIKLDN